MQAHGWCDGRESLFRGTSVIRQVRRVTLDRVPYRPQVNTDLVRAAGCRFDFQQAGLVASAFQHFEVRDRRGTS